MKRYSSWVVALILVTSATVSTGVRPARASSAMTTVDELLNLLPESHIVGVIDMPRAVRELLPRLKAIEAGGIAKLAADFEEFTSLAGLDATKVTAAVIGVRLEGLKVRGGALVVEGIALDTKSIERATSAKQWKFEVINSAAKPVFKVSRVRPAEQGKQDDLYLTQIGVNRAAAGDLESIKSVVANASAASADKFPAELNTTLRSTLKQRTSSGVVRFALVIPEDLRAMLSGQGDLFGQLATIKVVYGALDMTSDQSAAITAHLATNSKEEAVQMESGLKGLVLLGKSFLGGASDETLKGIGQLLDQVKIGVQESDVSLSLVISKVLLDQLTKSANPK